MDAIRRHRSLAALLLLAMSAMLGGCAAKAVVMQNWRKPALERELAKALPRAVSDARLLTRSTTQRYDPTSLTIPSEEDKNLGTGRRGFQCVAEPAALDPAAIGGITLDFEDSDVRDVLRELSLASGVSIVADDTVEGITSVRLANRTLAQALDVVLSAGNFSYKAFAHHILVGSAEPKSRTFPQLAHTCLFKPSNTLPEQLLAGLAPVFQPFVSIQPGARFVTVTAPGNVQPRVQAALLALDAAPQQVLLELSVVEVSVEALSILGVDWHGMVRDPLLPGGMRTRGIGEWSGAAQLDSAGTGLLSARLPARTLVESLQALKTSGEAQIRATPSIVTQDGREANFSSQNTVWISAESLSASNVSGDRRKELTYGINMTVIPRISDAGAVKLEIKQAQVSDFFVQEDGIPHIVSHAIANTVDVRDGDTLVLGGLFQRKVRERDSGLPLLGNMRLIGNLFGQDRRHQQETEVLILIRPVILGEPGRNAG
jgi:type II secretory pathway component GspD/PulD (secretin)